MITDSSVLLALLNPGDAHHAAARAVFERQGPQLIQQPALAETLQVVHVSARRSRGAAFARRAERQALDQLLQHFRFHVAAVEDLELALRVYQAHEELSFVDACGIADARSFGGLWTFDGGQEKIIHAL